MTRPARPADVAAVVGLEQRCFGTDAWSETLVRAELAGVQRTVLVAGEPEVVGYASVSVADEVADLHRLAVAPAARRTGVARDLLTTLVEVALAGGAQRMLLEVGEHNDPALRLYTSFGFETISRRRHYYADGSDSLVMQVPLASSGRRARLGP